MRWSSALVAVTFVAFSAVSVFAQSEPSSPIAELNRAVVSLAGVPADAPRPTVAAGLARLHPKRPSVLPPLYISLSVLQGLDIYSTSVALRGGATERNPLVGSVAGQVPAFIGAKAASTALTIYFAERLWKKNRVAAVGAMLAANGIIAAVVARNLHNQVRLVDVAR